MEKCDGNKNCSNCVDYDDCIQRGGAPIWTGILMLVVGLLFISLNGCDTTQADYKQKFEYQVSVNDTLRMKADTLTAKVEYIWRVHKIQKDSLNGIITLKNQEITSLNFIIANFKCDSVAIFRNWSVTVLDPYLFVPLNKRLNQIIDSLNRK